MPNRPDDSTLGSLSTGDSYVPSSGNGGYSVVSYDLELDYRVSTNRLTATAVISAVSTRDLSRFSFDFSGLVATRVLIDGTAAAKTTASARKLTIHPATTIRAGEEFVVTVRYAGAPKPVRSPWGELGWEELSDGVLVASQPSGAPSWFPCNDHPSAKALFSIRVTAESPYAVLANGRLVSRVRRASRTTWVYETSEPMATYLASIQIGLYKEVALASSPVPQKALVPASLLQRAQKDFAQQAEMLGLFSRLFGDYPFSEYSVVVTDDVLEIPIEAHGFAVFGRNHIDGLGGSERLVAHELAHSWFGNSVTATTWKDIWLHEGFACYAEWLWSEESGGPSADRLAHQHWGRLSSLPQDLIIGDPGPALMFDDRVYKRGALTLHALRTELGDDAFFDMLTSWTTENRFGNVTTESFYLHAQERSTLDLGPLFEAWLFSRRLPALPH
ncbi:M1 family metallopeptidase [Agreia sp. COWG]|uniref:M1 family metallopeptidase n=1 Tax=Agreia sp. COWG TaxID=2773266 RepID=UPI0019253B28|nr:M1 family metallopeptidase [Agreia sp. COWG]CAD6000263.1 Peptidase family M1 [Agreia sp. COWG]